MNYYVVTDFTLYPEPMLALVAPGQGAQTPGFLVPWLELPRAKELLSWWSAVARVDLLHLGTTADAEEIKATENAQPLLVGAGLLGALALFPHPSDAFGKVGVVAGHSVGEFTAAAGARAITAESAMVLVRERGLAMAKASAIKPTGMSAKLLPLAYLRIYRGWKRTLQREFECGHLLWLAHFIPLIWRARINTLLTLPAQ
jgi:malonyl CoA-acyl carrier protein transacylase